ncbi:MAG: 4Fe-4S binding protein [Alistipes sp.]|nr:4Fe-4S binding protein [Alistipes sp.]
MKTFDSFVDRHTGLNSKEDLQQMLATIGPLGAIPMIPRAEICQNCGKCVSRCPVGAISMADPRETDAEKCIVCMACVAECPIQARKVDPAILAGAKGKLKSALEGRKENELFL